MRLLFAIIILFAVPAFAADQYIDPSFTGTSNGTFAAPWKTWSQMSLSNVNPGDTIFLKRGQKHTSSQITFSRSGTSTAPIVITGYGTGAKPHLWGNGSVMQYLFNFSGRQYVIVDGLRIADTTIGVNDRNRVSNIQRAIGTGSYITIKNCDFDRCGLAVFFVQPFNTMQDCDTRNMRMIVNTLWVDSNGDGIRQSSEPQAEDDYGANGVVISSSFNTITRCNFVDCYATSLDYGWDGGGVEFFGPNADNNTITYSLFQNNNGENECGSNSGGSQDNNVIAYNKYINNAGFMLVQNSSLFTSTVSNLQIYNNVIIQNALTSFGRGSSGDMFRFRTTPTGSGLILFRNNIVYITSGMNWARTNQGGATTRSNNIYMVSNGNINYSLQSTEINGTFATMWESTLGPASSWNLTPGPSSQAINFGTPVGFNTDFIGKPITGNPDAGIIERTAVVQQPFKALIKFVQ